MSLIIDRERVKLLMRDSGISSFKELAERAKVHPNTLTRVLSGEPWSSDTAAKLAKALDCNPIDLITTEGFNDPNSIYRC